MSRRRTRTGNDDLPPGAFDGLVNISIYPARLSEGLARFAAEAPDILSLVRAEGDVLARSAGPRVAPCQRQDGLLRAAVSGGAERLVYEAGREAGGVPGLVAVRRIEGWPAYATAFRPREAVVAAWRRSAVVQAAVGVPASLALLGLALLLGRSQGRLARANAGLEARVARRTADLADSEARFRSTFEQAAIGIAHVAFGGGWLRVNRRLCEMLGHTEAELLATSFQDITHPDDLAADVEAVRLLTSGEAGTCTLQKRYIRKDDSVLWVDLTVSLMRDETGEPFAFLAAISDNSARKAAEAALAASEAEFRAIFAGTLVGMAQTDPATGRFLRVNRHFSELTGYPEEELLGRMTFPDLLHPDDLRAAAGRLAEALKSADRYEAETRLCRENGSVLHVVLQAARIDSVEGAPRTVITVQDITERHQAEDRQALLAREVDHRAKNALTVVQAALRLTPREDAASYARDVEGRVLALARAHTILADASWRGASLRGVVRAELAGLLSDVPLPHEEERAPRAVLDGPDLLLNPIAVQPLVMTVHELATNATKHGALSVPGGEVRLSWSHDRAAGLLRVCWEERGGPPPALPVRCGFGSRVIEATMREQLGGRVERRWTAGGLVYEAEMPAARVLADDTAPAPS